MKIETKISNLPKSQSKPLHILGWIISRDSFRGMWEVIQPAGEGKLEVSYRWFRTCKDAEDWCMRKGAGA